MKEENQQTKREGGQRGKECEEDKRQVEWGGKGDKGTKGTRMSRLLRRLKTSGTKGKRALTAMAQWKIILIISCCAVINYDPDIFTSQTWHEENMPSSKSNL